MYVKITTNQGITGWGEAVDAIPGTYYVLKNFAVAGEPQSSGCEPAIR